MIVIPAIDVRGGRAVRLVRGRPQEETVYGEDPAAVAGRFVDEGAGWLHVVDLDAALDQGDNRDTIRRLMQQTDASVQLGGGLRSVEAVERAVTDTGATRAVVGSAAIAPDFVARAVDRVGDALTVALDVEDDLVRVRGWTADAGRIGELLPRLTEAGAPRFLVTSIGRDGTLEGPDVALYERAVSMTDRPVLASGGVRSVDDLRSLVDTGVEGVVVGKALYELTLTVADALDVAG